MDGIHLNQRERLAVQLKRLPEADRWRIFMMQQHMLMSHIQTVEAMFDKEIAPMVMYPRQYYNINRVNLTECSDKMPVMEIECRDKESFSRLVAWIDGALLLKLPVAPSLRLSVNTHKLDLTRRPEGVKEVKA